MKLQGAEYAAGGVWHVHSSYGTTLAAIHRCLHGAATVVLAQESAVAISADGRANAAVCA